MTNSMICGENILIIDDILENLRLLDSLLTAAGYSVRPTSNGRMGLLTAQKKRPDLILLDIKMPDMDGYEVCEQLKADERTRDIPVIFISALHNTDEKLKAFRAGGVDYITKPFQEAEVLARINTHLALRRSQLRLEIQNRQLQREITERRQAEERLHRAKEDAMTAYMAAERANQAKSIFLANMSHELRTPLNSILGFSSMLCRSGNLDPNEKKNAHIIQRSGEHLLNLINDVLDLSKIEAGRIVLNEKDFDFHRLLEDVKDLFCMKTAEKGLQLIFEINADVARCIRADEVSLRRVLVNLIDNAVKFTEEGHIWLRIDSDVGNGEKDKIEIRFEIRDTGQGIAPHERDALFKPFVQCEKERKFQEGTGLGLAISQKLVRMMGGDILMESEIGKGTVFRFGIRAMKGNPANTQLTQPVKPGDDEDIATLKISGKKELKTVTKESLASLPSELLENLENAAMIGDSERIGSLIEEVRSHHRDLADALAALAGDFEYGKILKCRQIRDEQNGGQDISKRDHQ